MVLHGQQDVVGWLASVRASVVVVATE